MEKIFERDYYLNHLYREGRFLQWRRKEGIEIVQFLLHVHQM